MFYGKIETTEVIELKFSSLLWNDSLQYLYANNKIVLLSHLIITTPSYIIVFCIRLEFHKII